MITVRWTAILLSLALPKAESQLRHPVVAQRGDVSLIREAVARRTTATQDTVRVLAALVQFRADADPRTSGNGLFDRTTPAPPLPDPSPHDSSFFAGKIQFLSNYFRRASNATLTVTGTILPGVVTLDDSMAHYSPQGGRNQSLGWLVVDSWTRAVAAQPSFPYAEYDAFIIFHAGAGRDVDLVSLLGYDPTPNDIPSVYLSLEALRKSLGDPGFGGVGVPSSGFFITNSLILPETESRILDTGLGRDTLKLSINGIAAATLGSHLGLPDLFDVTTGRSGIGQFGLMDGAGIFAYNGLFPPDPSAWEKLRMGWLVPIELRRATETITVPAVGLVEAGSDTVFRVSISADEYYLIENRQRDPRGDGQRLTVIENGVPRELHFQSDTAGFSFADISAIRGSVVDVEDLDWATPGTTLQEGFEGGGILVWHIDEGIIESAIATNTVNADPSRRGVDLEEADGSQDIGQAYEFLQPGTGTEFGWPLDLWFAGNESPVYANRFDEKSYPNSFSNSGARSLISLRGFSQRSARMQLSVDIGAPELRVLEGLGRIVPGIGASAAPTVSPSGIYVTRDGAIYAFKSDGASKTSAPDGLLDSQGGTSAVAALERGSGRTLLASCHDSSLIVFDLRDLDADSVFESVNRTVVGLGRAASAAPAFVVGSDRYLLAVGLAGGSYALVDSLLAVSTLSSGTSNDVTQTLQLPSGVPGSLPTVYGLAGNRLFTAGSAADLPAGETDWKVAGFVTTGGARVVAVGASGGRMLLFNDQLAGIADVPLAPDSLRGLAVADLDRDGRKEIVLSGAASVRALNESGSNADGFPLKAPGGSAFVSSAVIADVDGDGSPELLLATSAGSIAAFGARGGLRTGYPVQGFGQGTTRLAVFQGPHGDVAFLGLTLDGALNGFETATPYDATLVIWSQELADAGHRNADLLVTTDPAPISAEFFPRSRVYNWPNPVYGNETRIRFYVAEDAVVSVKIFDLTGLAVTELSSPAAGGLDGEITWNVKDIESGVYLARVQASSQGRSDVAVIKIAVVK